MVIILHVAKIIFVIIVTTDYRKVIFVNHLVKKFIFYINKTCNKRNNITVALLNN